MDKKIKSLNEKREVRCSPTSLFYPLSPSTPLSGDSHADETKSKPTDFNKSKDSDTNIQ